MLTHRAVFQCLGILLTCSALGGCSGHGLKHLPDGYLVQRLPAPVLDGFTGTHEVALTVEDEQHGSSTVRGVAERSGRRGIKVVTTEALSFDPDFGDPETWLLIRCDTGTPGTCRGCPRDRTLQIYEDASICWCWSQVAGPF